MSPLHEVELQCQEENIYFLIKLTSAAVAHIIAGLETNHTQKHELYLSNILLTLV